MGIRRVARVSFEDSTPSVAEKPKVLASSI